MAGPLQNRSSQQPAEQELQRLHFLVSGLCSRFRLGTLAFVQVWMENSESSADVRTEGTPLLCSPMQPSFVGLPGLQSFRSASCDDGVSQQELGLLGRAFTGSLQVVQELSIVPKSQHPRNKLKGHEHAISEVVYIPVYDQEKLEEGVFAVVEVMLASETSESMAVANLITYASRFMEDVSLSITHELPSELSSRSSSATSSSACSTPGSLDHPHPRWQVSPRVDASDAHRPSFSRPSWTQHPTNSHPHPNSPTFQQNPLLYSVSSPPDATLSASATGIRQLQPDAAPFVPGRARAGAEARRSPARHGSMPPPPSAAQAAFVSPFAQLSTSRVSPTQGSPCGGAGLRRSPSIARTTSSRSLSDMSSGLAKGFSESPSQTWSDGACPAIPEVSSSPPPCPPCNSVEDYHSAAATHTAQTQLAEQQQGPLAEGSMSVTAAAKASSGLADAERMNPTAVGTGNDRSSAEASRAPRSQEPPGRTPWWRIPSKFIPGIGPVPPLAVC